jgi:hypothetical protein
MPQEQKVRRRNLSGIYIFEKFPEEDKRYPTCFEDCQEEAQDKYLEALSKEGVCRLAKMLGKTIRGLGDHFDILG